MSAVGCPRPAVLERGIFERDRAVLAHAKTCVRCGEALAEIEGLKQLAGRLRVDVPDEGAVEQVRHRLLSRPEASRRAVSPWWTLAAASAAMIALSLSWGGANQPPAALVPIHRGSYSAEAGAELWVASAQPDEIVRLHQGRLTLRVDPLQVGERFRVVTADAEVEVKGTVFEVRAEFDRLVEVRVLAGRVEVRVEGASPLTLGEGQRWARAPEAQASIPSPEPATMPAAKIVPAAQRRARPVEPEPPAPQAGWAEYRSGWDALRQSDFSAAAKAFASASLLATAPGIREDASYFHGVALARSGNAAEAEAVWLAGLRERPRSHWAPEIAAMIGWMAYDRGDDALALSRFERAASSTVARAQKSGRDGLRAIELRRPK